MPLDLIVWSNGYVHVMYVVKSSFKVLILLHTFFIHLSGFNFLSPFLSLSVLQNISDLAELKIKHSKEQCSLRYI